MSKIILYVVHILNIIAFFIVIYALFDSFAIKNTETPLYNLICDEKIILSNVEILYPNQTSDTWIYHKGKKQGSYRPKEETICYAEDLLIKSHNGSNEMINHISFDDNKK